VKSETATTMILERIITVFKRDNDSLFKMIKADEVDIPTLRLLFLARYDDPYYYRPYRLNKNAFKTLVEMVPELREFPLNKFDLFIEAHSKS
jgi:hypothetical protein